MIFNAIVLWFTVVDQMIIFCFLDVIDLFKHALYFAYFLKVVCLHDKDYKIICQLTLLLNGNITGFKQKPSLIYHSEKPFTCKLSTYCLSTIAQTPKHGWLSDAWTLVLEWFHSSGSWTVHFVCTYLKRLLVVQQGKSKYFKMNRSANDFKFGIWVFISYTIYLCSTYVLEFMSSRDLNVSVKFWLLFFVVFFLWGGGVPHSQKQSRRIRKRHLKNLKDLDW